jgi:peroxiredoxin
MLTPWLIASLLLVTPTFAKEATVGEAAPAFELTNLEGKTVKLEDYKGKTVVLEWFNPGCPFVKHVHEENGPLATLAAEQAKAGVSWLAINSGAPGNQGHGVEANKEAAKTWSMHHPILLDESGKVGKTYGATNTPQVFVVNSEGVLVYAGAVDSDPMGKQKAKARPYLWNALMALAEGQPVRTPRTKPYGCSVKY